MAELTRQTVIGRGTDHVETVVGDQTMMMSIRQGKYYALESTAQRIWQMIETPAAIGDVVDRLLAEYDVAPADCDADVKKFAAELLEQGLVVEISDGSES